MSKIVYQTGGDGVFVGATAADESPLEPGVWLIPAGCVEVPPPTIPAGNLARWVGDAWVLETVPAPSDPPAAAEPDPASSVPNTISRRQCAAELFAEGLITGTEAIAMTATATPPTVVETVLVAIPEPGQTFARLEFAAANYDRTNALVGAVMTALGKDAEARDAFFRAAAAR